MIRTLHLKGIHSALIYTAGFVLLMVLSAMPAAAKIKCNGPWQVVSGVGEIATPYCGDGYLAKVARRYGVKVSAKAIRYNPETKAEVCQLVGHDIRVSDICAGFDQDRFDRR